MAAKFPTFFPTRWFSLINGQTLNKLFNSPSTSYEDAITAHAGGGATNAYQLSAVLSRVTVCASANDSVKLPAAAKSVGATLTVINDGAQNLNVVGDATIDGVAVATGVTVGNAKRTDFFNVAGAWFSAGASKST